MKLNPDPDPQQRIVEDWKREARPTARLIAAENGAQLASQVAALKDYDARGSYVAAGGLATALASVVVLTGHAPQNPHLQDLAGLGLLASLGAVLSIAVGVWSPRPCDIPPNPRALREYWNRSEEDVLLALTDTKVVAWEKNTEVMKKKVDGLKSGIRCFMVALAIVIVTAFSIAIQGGH
jgi:hypothetical protein